MPCYHIIERYPSMRSGPAVKRCYGSRKVAEVTRKRGVTGDRADYYLDPSRPLGVVACYDLQRVDKLSTIPGNRVPGYFVGSVRECFTELTQFETLLASGTTA